MGMERHGLALLCARHALLSVFLVQSRIHLWIGPSDNVVRPYMPGRIQLSTRSWQTSGPSYHSTQHKMPYDTAFVQKQPHRHCGQHPTSRHCHANGYRPWTNTAAPWSNPLNARQHAAELRLLDPAHCYRATPPDEDPPPARQYSTPLSPHKGFASVHRKSERRLVVREE